jgi:hypothetical protein
VRERKGDEVNVENSENYKINNGVVVDAKVHSYLTSGTGMFEDWKSRRCLERRCKGRRG